MPTPNGAPPARHSAFAAAFFSFLLPGLGQIYAGRWRRGAFFMIPWLLAVALVAGTAFSMGIKEFGLQLGLDTAWLQYALAGITIDLIWRLLAVLDAFWISRAPKGVHDAPVRRVGSAIGLLAILAVLLGSHATIASPTYGQYDAMRCATDPDCLDNQVPDPTDGPGVGPDQSIPPLASLPPTLPPASLAPGETATPEPSQEPEPTALPDWTKGRLNVLLVGVNGALTDTLIVVSVDPDTKQVAFIGIPRDTLGFVVPKSLGKAAQYYGGGGFTARVNQIFTTARAHPELFPGKTDAQRGYGALTAMVGATLGIPIDYYVRVDMGGFRDVIDALGGAVVDVQSPVYDSRYASDDGRGVIKLYIPPGIHFLDGPEALAYSRSRHASSDFDRSTRQMRMITALRKQVDIPSLIGDIGTLQQIIKKDIRTNFKSSDLGKLAGLIQGIDLDKRISLQLTPNVYSTQCSEVPSAPLCDNSRFLGNAPYGLVPNIRAIQRDVKRVFSIDQDTLDRQVTLDSEAAVVEVLNGTKGTNVKTTNISDRLAQLGLNSTVPPVNAGKADRDDYPDTVITVYNGAADSKPETIKLLEDQFDVSVITADDPSQTADIVVIVGKSTPNLKPKTGQ